MKRASTEIEPGGVEAEFQRFRDEGDLDALGHVFDATGPRLLGLAARLAADASEAEDLVQATFLKALTSRDQWDASRPLLPWLAGILSHRAIDQGRRRRVRHALPLLDPDSKTGHAADPAAQAAFEDDRRTVLEGVRRLGEPYRELLALRITDELDTAELAARLGRSAATIRVQLARGRERLEALLPAELRLSALLLLDQGSVLEGVRGQVLSQGASLRAAAELGTSLAARPATAALGGWAGAKVAAVAAMATAALVAVLAVWMTADRTAPAGEPFSTVMAGQPGDRDPRASEPLVAVDSPTGAPSESALAGGAAVPEAATLRVEVQRENGSAGTLAPGVGVYVRRVGETWLGHQGVTDEEGVALFADLPRGRYRVSLGPVSGPPTEVAVLEARTLSLVIPDGVDVKGRVLAFDGTPVGGAHVYRMDRFHHDAAQWVATTGPSGQFEAADLASGVELLARAPGHQPTGGKRYGFSNRVRGVAGATQTIDLQLGALGHSLEGRVLGPDGQPAPFALVTIAVDEDARNNLHGMEPGSLSREDDATGSTKPQDTDSFLIRADAEGVFRSDEVPRGTVALFARALDDRSRIGTALVDVASAGVTPTQVFLEPGAMVVGRVLDTAGRPRVGIVLEARWEGTPALGHFESGFGEEAFLGRAISRSDGTYSIVGLLPGETTLRIINSNGGALLSNRVELEDAFEWNPVIPVHSELRVRAVTAAGEPLVGWRVCIQGAQSRVRLEEPFLTDENGRVHCRGLEEGERVITLHAPPQGTSPGRAVPLVHTRARPSEEEVVLVYDPAAACEVSGSVQLPEPTSPRGRGAKVQLMLEDFDQLGEQSLSDTGAFRWKSLPAGDYRLLLHARDAGVPRDLELAAFTLAPGESRDLGEFLPARGTVLVLHVDAAGRALPEDRDVRLRGTGSWRFSGTSYRLSRRSVDEPFRSEPLAPGAYTVFVDDDRSALSSRLIEIQAGAEEQQEFWSLDLGEPVELVIHFDREPDPDVDVVRPRCKSTEGRVDLTLFSGDSTELWGPRITEPYDMPGQKVLTIRRPMQPGLYHLWVEDERFDGWDKSWATVDFAVTEGALNRVEIHLSEPLPPRAR
ncbi:ECF RNA polymerase sigma factor SigW [Planctomycetes bacterium Poly30]|uniref:RNA polymerase sigma factor n=1 Tax=Saltatorellus ferox TaxID=2528018 RepID=A0A518EPL0_9BACT|nr:ECF RNA polymerase sigma factor SigW [Planctomycetes bacterium Poly30]